MSKNQIITILITIAEFIVFWNVVDYFTMTFISKEVYTFAVVKDLVVPILCGLGMGYANASHNK